jgi:hypothetical protein
MIGSARGITLRLYEGLNHARVVGGSLQHGGCPQLNRDSAVKGTGRDPAVLNEE